MIATQHEVGSARSRVVNAARHLFATRGFHQMSMAELAEEADVSVGAIYRSFKGKADIVLAIVEVDARARLETLASLSAQVKSGMTPVETALTRMALLSLSEGDEALSFEILAEAHRNADVARMIADLCVHYRNAFRDFACVANPRLSTMELDAAEELLLACMFGLGHRTLSGPRLGVNETAEYTAKMILHALNALHPDMG
ncbi:helix-turn-helix domain-containing protein [Sphingobium aquiterrae]|uniref:TetR/AcrR family transcriptional regulator n=1 Tax=Sphingobium aquiterrae TaxID=2038656 RepID=UPI0030189633